MEIKKIKLNKKKSKIIFIKKKNAWASKYCSAESTAVCKRVTVMDV